MANISNAKKYAVLWMNSQNKSLDEISKELNISNDQINDIITSNKPTETTAVTNKNLMITHTAGKKANHVAIMTKEASELNDSQLKKMTPQQSDKGIFRPKQK